MKEFKIFAGVSAAGWVPACGDALRAVGHQTVAALMLPPTAPTFDCAAPPLFRIRVCVRTVFLEKRVHQTPTGRCSRGRWDRVDSGPRPSNAREWAALAKFWAWYAGEIAEDNTPRYSWADDSGKDFNRCGRTRGRARRIGSSTPSHSEVFGYSPAGGHSLGYAPVLDAKARAIAQVHCGLAEIENEMRERAQTVEARRLASRKARRNAKRRSR